MNTVNKETGPAQHYIMAMLRTRITACHPTLAKGERGGFGRYGMILPLMLCFGLSGHPGEAHAEFFGRLFTSQEERAMLDKLRFAKPKIVKVEKKKPVALPPPEPPPTLNAFRMDGVVVRSSGPNTAWIDGDRVLHKGRVRQGVTVDPGSADQSGVYLTLPTGGEALKLKPGQAFQPEAGRVTEGYLGGQE